MKYAKKQSTKVIHSATAEQFQSELNKALEEVSEMGCKYELMFNNNQGFCAYIVYSAERLVPETASDRFHLKGETYRCGECPNFVKSKDGRVKYTTCMHGTMYCKADHDACDYFYEKLEKGEIQIEEHETVPTDPI